MTTDFEAALRAQLLQAAGRSQQLARRRRVAQLGAALLVVVVAAFAFSLGRAKPAAAGIDIDRVGDQLEVRLTEVEQEPDVVQRALREAGLDVTVVAVPAGPSQVGRFVGDTGSSEVSPLDSEGAAFRGFRVPVDWPGHLELRLGRAAQKGESYVTATDAFAAGEPLACAGVLGATLADAAGTLEASGLAVTVHAFAGSGPGSPTGVRLADAVASRPTWRIVGGRSLSSTSVDLVITADGTPVPGYDTTPRAPC